MPAQNQDDDSVFESQVRRLASELFPRARATGPVKIGGRERDGVYADGETIHVLEATVSQRRAKAVSDLEKSVELVRDLRRQFPNHNFKIWLITRNDPTADQNSLVSDIRKKAKCPVELSSYKNFSSKLVDASKYLDIRDNHPFGSVRRPENDQDFRVPEGEYVPIDLFNPTDQSTLAIDSVAQLMTDNPQILLLVGDFGAGKSMTLRHVYYGLKHQFLLGRSNKFPIYLNLRDHFGQRSPSEALMRHGEEIGFPLPNQLVAAWKGGHCHVFLDGFDELSSTRLVRGLRGLKQARREAMRLVHGFVTDHPKDTSLFISGRQHYFDSIDELRSALGLTRGFRYFTLNEFSQEQVATYLQRKHIALSIPDWLPSRPLLLGYLAVKGLLSSTQPNLASLSREMGWDHLLDRICEREARQIDPVSIDPLAVREFVERLATWCRQSGLGRGPIDLRDIRRIFEEVFAMPPDERAETLIFRMPGFTAALGQEDAREFLDDDYADACRSGDVVRYINATHDPRHNVLLAASMEMGDLGCRVASIKVENATAKQLSAALEKASQGQSPYLAFDILRIMQQRGADYTGKGAVIHDGLFDTYEVTKKPKFDDVELDGCLLSSVDVADVSATGPKFSNCQIENVHGSIGLGDIPPALLESKDGLAHFVDEAQTNADILELSIPVSVKVLMTVLRKLFVQPGGGRKENAFYRGLDARAKAYVPVILSLVGRFEFARPHRISGPVVWVPDRSRAKRAHSILSAPQQSEDPIVVETRSL
jgi:hypothetical protein